MEWFFGLRAGSRSAPGCLLTPAIEHARIPRIAMLRERKVICSTGISLAARAVSWRA